MKTRNKNKKAAILIACAVALASYQNASAVFTGALGTGTSTYTSGTPDPSTLDKRSTAFTPGSAGVVTFDMESGTFTVLVNTNAIWGDVHNSTINVTGGSLTLNSNTGSGSGALTAITLGSGSGEVFTCNVSAGIFTIDSTETGAGLSTAKNSATADFNLSGTGEIVANVTTFQLNTASAGSTQFNLAGSSLLEVTSLADFTSSSLAFNNGATINFATGSQAEFSLSDLAGAASQSDFNTLIGNGDFAINGVVDKTTSDFTYTTSDGQGILSLADSAAVPEPSTYLMMGIGFLGLIVLGRFRRSAV